MHAIADGQAPEITDILAAVTRVDPHARLLLSQICTADTALAKLKLETRTRGEVLGQAGIPGKSRACRRFIVAPAASIVRPTAPALRRAGRLHRPPFAGRSPPCRLRRKAQKNAKDSIKSATTKAVADPWIYVTWARGRYEDSTT